MDGKQQDSHTIDVVLILHKNLMTMYTCWGQVLQFYCFQSQVLLELFPTAGCGSPSPLTNGRIHSYLSGSVGSLLTFECNTGYLPHDQTMSTCMANGSWIPTPHLANGSWVPTPHCMWPGRYVIHTPQCMCLYSATGYAVSVCNTALKLSDRQFLDHGDITLYHDGVTKKTLPFECFRLIPIY